MARMADRSKQLNPSTRGSRHPLKVLMQIKVQSRWKTDSKATETISQGAGAFALSQTPTIDPACIKQLSCSIIAFIQASLILLSVVLSATQGIRRSLGLQTMRHLCPRRSRVSSTAHMADRSKELNLSARGPGRQGAAYRKSATDKQLS